MKAKLCFTAIFLCLFFSGSHAQVHGEESPEKKEIERPVTSVWMLEGGTAHLADTYLTPLHYNGCHFGVSWQRLRAMKCNPANWLSQFEISLKTDKAENEAKNADMWNLDLDFRMNFARKFRLPLDFTVAPGLGLNANVGVLYLDRNGNNPVSAKASLTVNATALVRKSVRIAGVNVDFTYQPAMPLAGAFFSPDYGELYYEIYLGNHKNLCHFAWPGNFFRLDNLVSADIYIGGNALRLGYSNTIFSSKTNNIVTRRITHAFVIGVSAGWLNVSPYKAKNKNKGSKLVFAL